MRSECCVLHWPILIRLLGSPLLWNTSPATKHLCAGFNTPTQRRRRYDRAALSTTSSASDLILVLRPIELWDACAPAESCSLEFYRGSVKTAGMLSSVAYWNGDMMKFANLFQDIATPSSFSVAASLSTLICLTACVDVGAQRATPGGFDPIRLQGEFAAATALQLLHTVDSIPEDIRFLFSALDEPEVPADLGMEWSISDSHVP